MRGEFTTNVVSVAVNWNRCLLRQIFGHRKHRRLFCIASITLALSACLSDTKQSESIVVGSPEQAISSEENAAPDASILPTLEAVQPMNVLEGPIGEFGPYLDAAQSAFESYKGLNQLADLDPSTGPLFLDAVLFGPLNMHAKDKGPVGYPSLAILDFGASSKFHWIYNSVTDPFFSLLHATSNAERSCGGSMRWTNARTIPDTDLLEVSVTYNNCNKFVRDGNSYKMTGSISYASQPEQANPVDTARFIKYNNFKIEFEDGVNYTINGVDSLAFGNAYCNANRPLRSYLRIDNNSTGETWLIENLTSTLFRNTSGRTQIDGAGVSRCAGLPMGNNEGFSGRIAHSKHGVIMVPRSSEQVQAIPSLTLLGADSKVEFESITAPAPAAISRDLYTLGAASKAATVTYAVANEVRFETSLSESSLYQGALSAFADSDADALADGWELIHGLNPYDSSDADSDVDGDYLSATQEYMLFTDPTDSLSAGWLSDPRIFFLSSASKSSFEGYTSYLSRISIENLIHRVRLKRFSFQLVVDGEAEFTGQELTTRSPWHNETFITGGLQCSFEEDNRQKLFCESASEAICESNWAGDKTVTRCEDSFLIPRYVHVRAPDDARFTITAILEPGPQELNLSNNTANVTH